MFNNQHGALKLGPTRARSADRSSVTVHHLFSHLLVGIELEGSYPITMATIEHIVALNRNLRYFTTFQSGRKRGYFLCYCFRAWRVARFKIIHQRRNLRREKATAAGKKRYKQVTISSIKRLFIVLTAIVFFFNITKLILVKLLPTNQLYDCRRSNNRRMLLL